MKFLIWTFDETELYDAHIAHANDMGELQKLIAQDAADFYEAEAGINGDLIILVSQRVPGDLEVMREDFARREAERLQAGG